MKELIKGVLGPAWPTIFRINEGLKQRARQMGWGKKAEIRQVAQFEELLKVAKLNNQPFKIEVGSSGIYEKGWLPSEYHFLNLLKEEDWLKYFTHDQVDSISAEHVWEHLTLEEGQLAVNTCYKFLKNGGRLRIAVPDGYHQDENYINYVKPGGKGTGAFDHKVLYTYLTLSKILRNAGFRVELLEWFDEKGKFHAEAWKKEDGMIHRSIKYDKRNSDGKPHYTSIIIDGIKD